MSAGSRRRSSNIRAMQLFHELKQQFPTVPDHVVTACIASHIHSPSPNPDNTIRDLLAAAVLDQLPQEPMGRSPSLPQESPPHAFPLRSPPIDDPEPATAFNERNEMNDSESDINRNVLKSTGVKFTKKNETVSVCTSGRSVFHVKRPDRLDIPPAGGIQPSEKCKDLPKLLNSDRVSEKPPRSPLTNRHRSPSAITKKSPETVRKKETASTPTQTTDTLLGCNSVNVSLNVNCSMDVVQSPTRRTSVLQVTPMQPWLQEPLSPKSYTSVNLTLRPPSSEPQPPIDITSRNSSLTYSTSSFDSQKGLQSRLQITVGPGGGSVSSTRTRPKSSYHPEGPSNEVVPHRAGSLGNLKANVEPPVILKQQARIERLKIELRTEKAKLEVMQNEVADLEKNRAKPIEYKTDAEIEKQLRREIKHLQFQCEQLAQEGDKNGPVDVQENFYQNIYTGQRGPLNIEGSARVHRIESHFCGFPPQQQQQDSDGPKWNCHLCTFLNHPYLDKCEQCEMPRILHGNRPTTPNVNYNIQQPFPTNYNLVPSYSLPNFHHDTPMVINRPIGFVVDNDRAQNYHSNRPQFTRPNL